MFESDAIDSPPPPRPIVMGLRHEIEAWKDFDILGVNSMKEGLSINIRCYLLYHRITSLTFRESQCRNKAQWTNLYSKYINKFKIYHISYYQSVASEDQQRVASYLTHTRKL